jgi:hypothetical protein
MTCREFRHLWMTREADRSAGPRVVRPSDEGDGRLPLPDAARTHLAVCTSCAAFAQADRSTDAALRRLAAAQPAPSVDAARIAIRRAIEQQTPAPKSAKGKGFPFRHLTSLPAWLGMPAPWPGLPLRGISLAAAGLAGAAVVAALVLRSPGTAHMPAAKSTVASAPLGAGGVNVLPRSVPSSQAGTTLAPPRLADLAPLRRSLPAVGPTMPSQPTVGPTLAEGLAAEPHYPWWASAPEDAGAPSVPRDPGDLDYLNQEPRIAISGWVRIPEDEMARLERKFLNAVKGGDRFVTVPFPRIAMAGPDSNHAIAQVVSTYKRQVAIVDPRLFRKVTLNFKGTPLAELCDRLRADTGIQVAAGQSVGDEKVTVFCKETPLRDVMRQLSRPFGYAWLRNGKEGDYRYELVQDLRAQLMEEDLRLKDRNAALVALDQEMQRYRPYLSLSPDEALARAKGAPASEKPVLERLGGAWWGPAHMYFRLSSRDLSALRAGQELRFSAEPEMGEQPLAPEVARGVCQSWRDWRVRKVEKEFIFGPRSEVPDGLPPASVPETVARVSFKIRQSELGQFTLDGGSGLAVGGNRSIINDPLAEGMSPAVRDPQNEKFNTKLARDPALRLRVTIRPQASCRLAPAESTSVGNAPEPKVTTADVLEALHRASKMPVVADYYTRLYPAGSVSVRNMPLFKALNRLADTMRLRWEKDNDGGWLQFRSASFFNDRIKEVPNRLMGRWAAARRARGALMLDDLVEIVQLSDAQLNSPNVADGAQNCFGLAEWSLARKSVLRPHLRYLAQLTPAQRQQAQSAEGLPFAQMSLAQQQGFLALALGPHADRLKSGLEDLAGAALRVDYTLPGGFQWARPEAPGAPRWQTLLPSTVRERTREAALTAAHRIDPQIADAQIVPTELAITVFYTLGGANGRVAPVVVRATPKSTRTMTQDPSGTRTADSTDTE